MKEATTGKKMAEAKNGCETKPLPVAGIEALAGGPETPETFGDATSGQGGEAPPLTP